MTMAQKWMLKHFYDNQMGAIFFHKKWIFPQDIRDNERLAEQMADYLFDQQMLKNKENA